MIRRAAIIVIGNEVLSGKVDEINSTFLIRALHDVGTPVARVSMVPDEPDVIGAEVLRFSADFDWVITTGGVGPTHDDVTFAAIAAAFDEELVVFPELERCIRDFFGAACSPIYLRMARLPRSTQLIWNEGLLFPVSRVRNVFVMPGDPTVLRKKFTALAKTFRQTPLHLHQIYTRLEEGDLADLMEAAERETPGVAIGSYPVYTNPDYRVRITIESRDAASARGAFERLLADIPPATVWRAE